MTDDVISKVLSTYTAEREMDAIEDQLREVLAPLGVVVPKPFLQTFKDKRHWIKYTTRVDDLSDLISQTGDVINTFSFDHFVICAIRLFKKRIEFKRNTVVVGQISQGKSQFLFFLYRLLQDLDEIVIYVDDSVARTDRHCNMKIAREWKTDKWNDVCQRSLPTSRTTPKDAADIFFGDLEEFAESHRVWVIADEIVKLREAKFPMPLPEEQSSVPFQYIVTGSAGIGSWVAKRHLKKWIFDYPFFTQEETWNIATQVAQNIGLEMREGFGGITFEGLPEFFENVFGGVIGLVVEFLISKKLGHDTSMHMSSLHDRVQLLLKPCAPHADKILREIECFGDSWVSIRDCGLCGLNEPRGIILVWILEFLFHGADANLMSIVNSLRNSGRIANDPGLDGCLLELQTISKLKAGRADSGTYLMREQIGKDWCWTKADSMTFEKPCQKNIYYKDDSLSGSLDGGGSRFLIHLPPCFDLIDVVMVDVMVETSNTKCAVYGIQITRSSKPFSKHHTIDTSKAKSREKLAMLCQAISKMLDISVTVDSMKYVMYAPYCSLGEHKPPPKHTIPDNLKEGKARKLKELDGKAGAKAKKLKNKHH